MDHAEKAVDEILGMYQKYGNADYIGEPVSQIEHMSQAAELAIAQGYGDETVLAAFFHDIGHICVMSNAENQMGGFGIRSHETIGAEYLRQCGFPPAVTRPVENHVDSKRYLTFRVPDYYLKLSEASKQTLAYQGGPMSMAEAEAFEQDPFFKQSLQLRLWDEAAKEEHQPLIDMDEIRQRALRVLRRSSLQG